MASSSASSSSSSSAAAAALPPLRVAQFLGAKKHAKMGFGSFESFVAGRLKEQDADAAGLPAVGGAVVALDPFASRDVFAAQVREARPHVVLLKVTDELSLLAKTAAAASAEEGASKGAPDAAVAAAARVVENCEEVLPAVLAEVAAATGEPAGVVLDPVARQRLTMSREVFGDVVAALGVDADVAKATSVRLSGARQASLSAADADDVAARLAAAGVEFPVVCKTTAACGTAATHIMWICFTVAQVAEQLRAHATEASLIVQPFHNHSGVIYKVFCMADYFHVVKRKSLPDMPAPPEAGTPEDDAPPRLEFDSQDQSPFADVAALHAAAAAADAAVADAPLPPDSVLQPVVSAMRRLLGMELFGFDLIIDNKTQEHVIIDVNYFPNFHGVDNFNHRFLNFLNDARASHPTTTSQ